jgi:hypothetical protein
LGKLEGMSIGESRKAGYRAAVKLNCRRNYFMLTPQQEFAAVCDLKSCQDLEEMRKMALTLLASWQQSQSMILQLMERDLPRLPPKCSSNLLD